MTELMRSIPVFLLLAFLASACQVQEPGDVYTVQNVLLPLEPPLTPRTIQSRVIRDLVLPAKDMAGLVSVRLIKAEIGNPDFPDFHFASEIRLSLIDPDGKIVLIAASGKIPRNRASIQLKPTGNQDLTRFFQQKKLDMLLEADNTLTSEKGIMLIGNFDFSYEVGS